MGNRSWGALAGVAVVVAGVLGGPAANAASAPDADDLTPQQEQAISAWEQGASGVVKDTAPAKPQASSGTTAAAASGTRTLRLYRGSWAMWGQETVQFGFSGTRVTWSSAWQDSGWVFPNNVTEGGTTRYYTSSATHQWRGRYTVGAGVPTPWGNVNVYSDTSWARSQIKSIGAIQWWDS